MRSEPLAAGKIREKLRESVDLKARQRSQRLGNYNMQKTSIHERSVGGQLAISSEADYETDGVKMFEYHTWAVSEKTYVYISARCPASDAADAKVRIDSLLNTFMVN